MENGDVECRFNGEWGREMENEEWESEWGGMGNGEWGVGNRV